MIRSLFSLWMVAAVSAQVLAADAPAAKPLQFETKRIVVFKDGYCLFVKEAPVVADAEGIAFTDKVPDDAILGAFWATPSKGRFLAMIAGRTERKVEKKSDGVCLSIAELVKANVGKKVSLERQNGQHVETLAGTIKMVLEDPPRPDLDGDDTAAADAARKPSPLSGYFPPAGKPTREPNRSDLFVLATDKGETVLAASEVRVLTVEGLATTTPRTTTKTESVKRLVFQLDKDAADKGVTVNLMHFGPGIRWIPTYRVDIADKKTARMELQGEILNEAEDIRDAAVDLVVGVPNFRFKDTISPLCLEADLRQALRAAAPGLMRQDLGNNRFSNGNFEQREGNWGGEPGAARAADIRLPAELTSGGSQDLYLYSMPSLTIQKGQRAAVPIFSANVPFRHLYTWDLNIQRAPTEAVPGSGDRASPVQLLRNDVWHQVELTNNTDKPWTTGSVLLMEGAMPLSQELLTYTSAGGGRVLVPVTVAVDVRGTFSEKEIGRDPNAVQFDNASYMRIRKTGSVTVTNRKGEDIDVVITCQFGGHCDSASDKGAITLTDFQGNDWRDYRGQPAVNQHSTVRWTLQLKKGETKTLDVVYYYFTR